MLGEDSPVFASGRALRKLRSCAAREFVAFGGFLHPGHSGAVRFWLTYGSHIECRKRG